MKDFINRIYSKLNPPYIKIGNGNINLYIEKLNEKLAKIIG